MDNAVCAPVERPRARAALGVHGRYRQVALVIVLVATLGCGVPGVSVGSDGRTALDGSCSEGRPGGLTADDLVGGWRLEEEQSKGVRDMMTKTRPAPFELRSDGKVVVTLRGGEKVTGTWEVTADDGYGHDLELDIESNHRDVPHSHLWVIRREKKFYIYNLIGDPDACHVVWYTRQAA